MWGQSRLTGRTVEDADAVMKEKETMKIISLIYKYQPRWSCKYMIQIKLRKKNILPAYLVLEEYFQTNMLLPFNLIVLNFLDLTTFEFITANSQLTQQSTDFYRFTSEACFFFFFWLC